MAFLLKAYINSVYSRRDSGFLNLPLHDQFYSCKLEIAHTKTKNLTFLKIGLQVCLKICFYLHPKLYVKYGTWSFNNIPAIKFYF
jgi:hypothetical protein